MIDIHGVNIYPSLLGYGLHGSGQRRGGQIFLRDALRAGQVRHRLRSVVPSISLGLLPSPGSSFIDQATIAVAGKLSLEGASLWLSYPLSWSRCRVASLSHHYFNVCDTWQPWRRITAFCCPPSIISTLGQNFYMGPDGTRNLNEMQRI